ncbi:unnamed protein product [Lathyrus sativus]|nr:unnamed protein product [Lathyrus sativus]
MSRCRRCSPTSFTVRAYGSSSLSPTSCGSMNWVQRKIHLYNVTFGLYMLDWWERCTFNILVIVLMCFVVRYITQFVKRYVFLW